MLYLCVHAYIVHIPVSLLPDVDSAVLVGEDLMDPMLCFFKCPVEPVRRAA